MDVFSRKLASPAAALVALLSLGDAAAQASVRGEIVASFETFSYVGQTNRVDVTGLEIQQGDLTIAADRGTANRFDFERSEWRLEGNVRISAGSIRIAGDVAEFSAQSNQLVRFELEGRPATFEDLEPLSAGRASGAAEQLRYDAAEAVIALLGDARLAVGQNEVLGCDLIYAVDEESFRSGSSECDRPFRIRIVPTEGAAGSAAP
jgi:lipopolysaccharide transport protein LptA